MSAAGPTSALPVTSTELVLADAVEYLRKTFELPVE